MGSVEGKFDAWLEGELARELGSLQHVAPNREWVPARPWFRRLTVVSGAGGALAAKVATGVAVAAFAVGATGTAMTGSPNPTAWGLAIEEVASSAVPVRPDEAASPAAPGPRTALPTAPPPAAVAGSAARHEQRSEAGAGVSHQPEPARTPNPAHRVKQTPASGGHTKQQDGKARPRPSGSPGLSSDARTESQD
jgi:hypothetical protein